jgi:hypothetical protein
MPPAVVAFINDILSVFRVTARIKDAGGIETKPAMLASTGWYWPKTSTAAAPAGAPLEGGLRRAGAARRPSQDVGLRGNASGVRTGVLPATLDTRRTTCEELRQGSVNSRVSEPAFVEPGSWRLGASSGSGSAQRASTLSISHAPLAFRRLNLHRRASSLGVRLPTFGTYRALPLHAASARTEKISIWQLSNDTS